MNIDYKSRYALVCDLVGHQKPQTQEEENYCQLVEFQNDTWRPVIIKMLKTYINELEKAIQKEKGTPDSRL